MVVKPKEIEIFNKKINIKSNNCCSNKNISEENTNVKLNLYIHVNSICNAKCDFCNVHKTCNKNNKIDLVKLKEVLLELQSKNLLGRIALTGGEPMINFDNLNNVLNLITEVNKDSLITLNTNGYNFFDLLKLDNINRLYGIHLSRHHYNDNINNSIFKFITPSKEDIRIFQSKIKNRELLRLNCDLTKGYIDNFNQWKRYIDFAGELNIFRVGFVSLMPLNDYCKNNFIDYNNIVKDFNEDIIKVNKYYDLDVCECFNGLALSSIGKPIDFYFRKVKELNCPYTRQLVYTNDNKLTCGFGKEILY